MTAEALLPRTEALRRALSSCRASASKAAQKCRPANEAAFRGLLTRDFDHLLFAHGEPLVGGGKAALREFLERPVGHEDYDQAL